MFPLLPYFLAYAGGILMAFPETRAYALPGLLSASSTLAGAFLFWQERHLRRRIGWFLLAAWFAFGCLWPRHLDQPLPPNHIHRHLQETERADVVGRLAESPVVFPDSIQFLVDLETVQYGDAPVAVSGRARINLYQPAGLFAFGDRLKFSAIRLKLPRNFKNPGRFDFAVWMRRQGIDVLANASKARQVQRLAGPPPPALALLREQVLLSMLHTANLFLPPGHAALLEGMVLGEKQKLPDTLRDAYQATGLAHLLAVSGMNFGFVAVAVFAVGYPVIFRVLLRLQPGAVKAGIAWKLTAFAALVPVLLYMILVGNKVSSLRSGAMAILFLVSLLIDRAHSVANALLLAAFGLLLWNPESILDVSFQLSFVAVLAILLTMDFHSKLYADPVDRMGEKSFLRRFFEYTLIVSLAACLATLPFVAVHFNRISLISWWANLLMVPLANILFPLSLLALTFGLFSQTLAGIFLFPCSWLLWLFDELPQRFASLPFASVYVATPSDAWAILFYATLFGWPWWYLQHKRWAQADPRPGRRLWNKPVLAGLIFASLGALALLIWPRWPVSDSRTLSVWMLDVGQGESLCIEFPNGETLLVDGGGFYKNAPDAGRKILAPFLWNRGRTRIDYILATHSDHDHTGGLESLMDFFPVGHLLFPESSDQDFRLRRMKEKAQAHDIAILPLQFGAPFKAGGASLHLLHPSNEYLAQPRKSKKAKSHNNNSLVLRLEYKQFQMLLTGDIEKDAETQLVANNQPLHAEILKVPHHGSKTSSTAEFIQAVAPKTALISSGYINIYHHPHPDVLQRYEEAGIRVWRTDRQGAIHITTDGATTTLQSHEGL
jgi:competence protein ComEC